MPRTCLPCASHSPWGGKRSLLGLALCLLLLLTWSASSHAQRWNPFAQGRWRLSLLASGGHGVGRSAGQSYLVIGLGTGYYILDGLEVGADTEAWVLGHPTLLSVSPQVRYVFHQIPVIKPYVGTFYRRAFVLSSPDPDNPPPSEDEFADRNSLGARVGAFYVTGPSYVGAGVAYEHWLGCDTREATWGSCNAFYPEILFATVF